MCEEKLQCRETREQRSQRGWNARPEAEAPAGATGSDLVILRSPFGPSDHQPSPYSPLRPFLNYRDQPVNLLSPLFLSTVRASLLFLSSRCFHPSFTFQLSPSLMSVSRAPKRTNQEPEIFRILVVALFSIRFYMSTGNFVWARLYFCSYVL